LKVAFVITENANVMDLAGPWEVFQDTQENGRPAFEIFTVSEKTDRLSMSGGLQVVPQYTFTNAPEADIIVVGAQRGAPDLSAWLLERAKAGQILMSVCTGAFKLAQAGLLEGKKATTHHEFWDEFAAQFPKTELVRGSRFVQSDARLYTAGGLTSGVDLALHIVGKFFGTETADRTARYMEYERVQK
jgi:transcriptional regulator GlxA family with amidase domain